MRKLLGVALLLVLVAALSAFSQWASYSEISIGGVHAARISQIAHHRGDVDFAAVAANTSAANATILALTGCNIGDNVVVTPSAALGAGVALGECFSNAADQITCVLINSTAAPVDPGAQSMDKLCIRSR